MCKKIIKKIWPFLIGVFMTVILFIFPKFFEDTWIWMCLIPLITPFGVVAVQTKNGWFFAAVGLVLGGGIGFLFGSHFGTKITELIYGPIPVEHDIRIDLLIWASIFMGFFASIFAIIGGMVGRNFAKN